MTTTLRPPAAAVGVHCLGVGEGWPCPDRRHAAFLYEFGKTRLLVDCGSNVGGALMRKSIPIGSLDGILLSHFHSDHVGGFSMLVQAAWLERRRRPLRIHAPGAGIPALQRWLEATLLFPGLIGFPTDWRPLKPSVRFRVGGVGVLPFATGHLEGLRRAFGSGRRGTSFEAFGFELVGGGRRIVHSADLGGVEDLIPSLRRPVDLLVCEVSHFEPGSLWPALRGRDLRRLALVHLDRDLWRGRRALIRDARRELPGVEVTVPADGDHLVA